MSIYTFCVLFICFQASSQRIMPGQFPCSGLMKPTPLTRCGNPQPIRNTVLGCLEPIITSCGTVTEVPMNLGMILPTAAPLASPCLPTALANPIMPPATLPLANPFLPVASPVSAYMPSFSPLLPPASPCNNRCQYLKKIPIPPPCI